MVYERSELFWDRRSSSEANFAIQLAWVEKFREANCDAAV
jgi:hypothetical protein